MNVGHLPGKAIEAFKNREKAGAGGCMSNDFETSGVSGGGGSIPPGGPGGGEVPNFVPPTDSSNISGEARSGGGGSSDLAGIKELLGSLCN